VRYTGGSPRAAIEAQVAHARHGGLWDQNGITSTNARNALPPVTTLGVIEGSEFDSLYGAARAVLRSSHRQQLGARPLHLLRRREFQRQGRRRGLRQARHELQQPVRQRKHGGWFNGDFDYNGKIDGADYALIDTAFNAQGTPIPGEGAGPGAFPGGQTVPEPTTLGLALLLGSAT
jgi:hypothetical protein